MLSDMHGKGEGGSVQQLRDHNRSLVLRWLSRSGGLARSEIAQRVRLTDAAISRIVRDLIDAGIVEEGAPIIASSRPGRRQIALSLVPEAAVVAAVRLTLFDHGVSLVNLRGERVANVDLPDAMNAAGDDLPAMVAEAMEQAAAQARLPMSRLLGAGVVLVGAVDEDIGRVRVSSLPGVTNFLLGPALERRLGLPVRVRTAGHALNIGEGIRAEQRAIAEGGDASPQAGTVLLLHVAFGLGASVTLPGRPYSGHQDERMIGHIPVPGATGACLCGAQGCLLTCASGHAVMRSLMNREPGLDNPEELGEFDPALLTHALAQADAGDARAVAAFHTAGRHLGLALFAGAALIPPERVVLAGIVGRSRAYAAGVAEGMRDAWGRIGQSPPAFVVSDLDTGRAAELFALDEFLLNGPIDIQRLQAA